MPPVPGRFWLRNASSMPPSRWPMVEQIDELHLKGFSRPARVFDINEVTDARRRQGRRNDRAADHGRSGRATRRLSDLDDSSATRPVRGPAAADAVGLGRVEAGPGGRVGGHRAVRHRRPGGRRRFSHHPGVRGAAPLPAPAAATARAADDLCDLDADQPADHRVLPRAAPRGDPEPRAGSADPDLHRRLLRPSAQPEAPGTSPAARSQSQRTSRTAPVVTSSPTTRPRSSATSL